MTPPQAEGRATVGGMPPMDERLRRSAEAAAMARATPPPDPHWGWIPPPEADEAGVWYHCRDGQFVEFAS